MTIEKVEYIVGEMGEKKAVILPIEEYEKLMEDLRDLEIIAERKEELELSLEELKKRMKENGLLD